MSTGRTHKGDSIASLLASDELREKTMTKPPNKRRGVKNASLMNLSLIMKESQRNDRLMAGYDLGSDNGQYSETAQEIKMRKAAEKRARRAMQ